MSDGLFPAGIITPTKSVGDGIGGGVSDAAGAAGFGCALHSAHRPSPNVATPQLGHAIPGGSSNVIGGVKSRGHSGCRAWSQAHAPTVSASLTSTPLIQSSSSIEDRKALP